MKRHKDRFHLRQVLRAPDISKSRDDCDRTDKQSAMPTLWFVCRINDDYSLENEAHGKGISGHERLPAYSR